MRMSTSAGGSRLAKRDNVALATARRARINDARNPLSPTTIRKTCFLKQVFFARRLGGFAYDEVKMDFVIGENHALFTSIDDATA